MISTKQVIDFETRTGSFARSSKIVPGDCRYNFVNCCGSSSSLGLVIIWELNWESCPTHRSLVIPTMYNKRLPPGLADLI